VKAQDAGLFGKIQGTPGKICDQPLKSRPISARLRPRQTYFGNSDGQSGEHDAPLLALNILLEPTRPSAIEPPQTSKHQEKTSLLR